MITYGELQLLCFFLPSFTVLVVDDLGPAACDALSLNEQFLMFWSTVKPSEFWEPLA